MFNYGWVRRLLWKQDRGRRPKARTAVLWISNDFLSSLYRLSKLQALPPMADSSVGLWCHTRKLNEGKRLAAFL